MTISKRLKPDIGKKQEGFTLIETLVTLLVFSILIVIVSSAFISSLNLQRRALNTQQVVENASFILESMAKEIRVSQINNPGINPSTSLSMTHPVNGAVTYSLSGTDVLRSGNGSASNVINSNSVEFTRLQFLVSGASANDRLQPRVTIIAGVRSKNTNQQATIDVQTTVSQRFLSD